MPGRRKEEEIIRGLLKISQAISSELYLEDILSLIVTVTAGVMKSKICSLMLIDEKKQELVIRATQSISRQYIKKPNLKIGEGVANQSAIVIENAELMVKTKVIQEELETRKLVEKAKGILMKTQNLTEAEAFKKIQKLSMDTRKSKKEIAEAILLNEKLRK